MSDGTLTRMRVSSKLREEDWVTLRGKAAGEGMPTNSLIAAAIGQLPARPDVLQITLSRDDPKVSRVVNPSLRDDVAEQFQDAIEQAGLTLSSAVARVVHAVANGILTVDMSVNPRQ